MVLRDRPFSTARRGTPRGGSRPTTTLAVGMNRVMLFSPVPRSTSPGWQWRGGGRGYIAAYRRDIAGMGEMGCWRPGVDPLAARPEDLEVHLAELRKGRPGPGIDGPLDHRPPWALPLFGRGGHHCERSHLPTCARRTCLGDSPRHSRRIRWSPSSIR